MYDTYSKYSYLCKHKPSPQKQNRKNSNKLPDAYCRRFFCFKVQCCVVVDVAIRDDLQVQEVEESRTVSLGEVVLKLCSW